MMNSMAIDMGTVFHAINRLEKNYSGKNQYWKAVNPEQAVALEFYRVFHDMLSRSEGFKGKASPDWEVLNEFLEANDLGKMFDRSLNGIGIISILDELIQYSEEVSLCEIYGGDYNNHAGVKIPEGSYFVSHIQSLDNELICIHTKDNNSLWLTMPDSPPKNPVDLLQIVFNTMMSPVTGYLIGPFGHIKVPQIRLDLKPDISFLSGAYTYDQNSNKRWVISQAYQRFKLRTNLEGPRVIRRGTSPDETEILVFDRPFIGWLDHPGSNLPAAIFYADYDSWKAQ